MRVSELLRAIIAMIAPLSRSGTGLPMGKFPVLSKHSPFCKVRHFSGQPKPLAPRGQSAGTVRNVIIRGNYTLLEMRLALPVINPCY